MRAKCKHDTGVALASSGEGGGEESRVLVLPTFRSSMPSAGREFVQGRAIVESGLAPGVNSSGQSRAVSSAVPYGRVCGALSISIVERGVVSTPKRLENRTIPGCGVRAVHRLEAADCRSRAPGACRPEDRGSNLKPCEKKLSGRGGPQVRGERDHSRQRPLGYAADATRGTVVADSLRATFFQQQLGDVAAALLTDIEMSPSRSHSD